MVTDNTSYSLNSSMISSYLPNDGWESIFRFIIINDNDDDNRRYLNSLSLVSKQFLSVTNRFRLSFTFNRKLTHNIFERFPNFNSLNFKTPCNDLDNLLIEISSFPLKQLTSLNLSNQATIPANGLRVFSQKITTLTSLTCSYICSFSTSYLFLIAECFPLLQELDLSFPSGCNDYSSYVDGIESLSLALIKLRKVNLSEFPINNQSLFHLFNNCNHLEDVIIFQCREITREGLASALYIRPTLRSLSFSMSLFHPEHKQVFPTSLLIDSLVSLKGLTCLVLKYLNISNELLSSIAREDLPLKRLVLRFCTNFSYNGIFDLLCYCRQLQHLDLQHADFLNDQHVVQLSSFLGDLESINLSCCLRLTQLTLFTLARNCPSLSEIKMERIKADKYVWNTDSLEEFRVYPQLKSLYLGGNSWLSDENIIMLASIFPNLQLLDLNYCDRISYGICEVLRKCCKIRHLNLSYCSRVTLHGMNFVVPRLEVLNLSNTKVDDETLYVISKNCFGLLQLILDNCSGVTEKGVKFVRKNCRQLSMDTSYLSSLVGNF